ncbi:MAG: FecR domain-containing protein [Opitutus sp.]
MQPPSSSSSSENEALIRDVAARWVVRSDRRLSPEESVEFQQWMAADPRHSDAFSRSKGAWRTFRELGSAVQRAPAPTPLPASAPRWSHPAWMTLAAAAAVALVVVLYWTKSGRELTPSSAVAASRPSAITQQLPDGSIVQLNAGAKIVEEFTPGERRIRLVSGEAFFSVTKDAARPFLVQTGEITVRAVGTAFSVRAAAHDVDVWVTEGTVQVTPAGSTANGESSRLARAPAMVSAGHRAVVMREPDVQAPAIVVTAVSAQQIAQTLAWNQPMLALTGSTLEELVEMYSTRTGRRIEIASPALRLVRIGGRFPTDDLDGFVRALGQIYEVRSEVRADGVIILRSAR